MAIPENEYEDPRFRYGEITEERFRWFLVLGNPCHAAQECIDLTTCKRYVLFWHGWSLPPRIGPTKILYETPARRWILRDGVWSYTSPDDYDWEGMSDEDNLESPRVHKRYFEVFREIAPDQAVELFRQFRFKFSEIPPSLSEHFSQEALANELVNEEAVRKAKLRQIGGGVVEFGSVLPPRRVLPRWEPNTGTLFFGHAILAKYNKPELAKNQIKLIESFQAQNWVKKINSPFEKVIDDQLENTIDDLNTKLKKQNPDPLILFSKDQNQATWRRSV